MSSEVVEATPTHGISYRKTFIAMLISSVLSLGASLVLAVDAWNLAKNANAKLFCDINAIVSCGKVALSWQSSLLGFPNPYIGLMCEPVVITVAIAGLSNMRFPKWFLKSALAVYGLGLVFALWLLSQSFFVIHAFCPWCLVVTISTVTVFNTMLRINLLENSFNFGEQRYQAIVDRLRNNWDYLAVGLVYTIIVVAIMFKYGKYFLP